MMKKMRQNFLATLVLCFCGQMVFTLFLNAAPNSKKKLAVLKIEYENFSMEERKKIEAAFLQALKQDKRLSVIAETGALSKLGMPGKMVKFDSLGFWQKAGIDYVLKGKIVKIGTFVDVSLQLLMVPAQEAEKIAGGKTLNIFIEQGVPQIVQKIHQTVGLEPEGNRSKLWAWIAGGVVVSGGIMAALLLNQGEDKQALPKPPAP